MVHSFNVANLQKKEHLCASCPELFVQFLWHFFMARLSNDRFGDVKLSGVLKFRFELILAFFEVTYCRWRKERGGLCERRDEQKGAPRKPPRCNYVFERPFIPYIFRTPPNLKPLNSAQPVKTPGQSLTALQYFHLQQDFSYFCLGQEFHSHNVSRLNLKQDEEDSSKISLVVTPRDRLGVGACLFFLGRALRV